MKKLTIIIALLLSYICNAQLGSDVTQVNVILSESASIEVMHNTVNLVVDTADKYENGTNSNLPSHLKITSTVDYQLNMQLSSNFTDGSNSIAANKVNVTVQEQTVALNTNQTNLLPSNAACIARYLDVNYTLEGGNHLLLPASTYTAQLTYTLMPQ